MKYTIKSIENILYDYSDFTSKLLNIVRIMYAKKYNYVCNFDENSIDWLAVDGKKGAVHVCLLEEGEYHIYSLDEYIPVGYFSMTDVELIAKRDEIEAAERAENEAKAKKIAEARSVSAKKAAATRAKNKQARELAQLAKLKAKYESKGV